MKPTRMTRSYHDAGGVVRHRREATGMTLRTLASMAGIGASAMSQIEKGQIRPGIQVAKAIILALPFGLREIARMRDCWSAPERATVKLWDGIWDGLSA